jgi:hypothetical protein
MTRLPAPFPLADLHAQAPDAAENIEALRSELDNEHPNRATIETHVAALRGHGGLIATLESWYLSDHTQAFLAELGALGL